MLQNRWRGDSCSIGLEVGWLGQRGAGKGTDIRFVISFTEHEHENCSASFEHLLGLRTTNLNCPFKRHRRSLDSTIRRSLYHVRALDDRTGNDAGRPGVAVYTKKDARISRRGKKLSS